MAGHGILPGCQTEWRHDCPGQEGPPVPDVMAPVDEITLGGVVCSCPCHRLARVADRLGAKVVELESELARTRRYRTGWTTGYRR
jgi:hypothetical protein